MEQGYRSEVQERALVVSLQMFSLILERGVSLLKAQLESGQEPRLVVGEDLQVLLPAIKVGRFGTRVARMAHVRHYGTIGGSLPLQW